MSAPIYSILPESLSVLLPGELREFTKRQSIVVDISPLLSLMYDQASELAWSMMGVIAIFE